MRREPVIYPGWGPVNHVIYQSNVIKWNLGRSLSINYRLLFDLLPKRFNLTGKAAFRHKAFTATRFIRVKQESAEKWVVFTIGTITHTFDG